MRDKLDPTLAFLFSGSDAALQELKRGESGELRVLAREIAAVGESLGPGEAG
jgi:hypothetical protein